MALRAPMRCASLGFTRRRGVGRRVGLSVRRLLFVTRLHAIRGISPAGDCAAISLPAEIMVPAVEASNSLSVLREIRNWKALLPGCTPTDRQAAARRRLLCAEPGKFRRLRRRSQGLGFLSDTFRSIVTRRFWLPALPATDASQDRRIGTVRRGLERSISRHRARDKVRATAATRVGSALETGQPGKSGQGAFEQRA